MCVKGKQITAYLPMGVKLYLNFTVHNCMCVVTYVHRYGITDHVHAITDDKFCNLVSFMISEYASS